MNNKSFNNNVNTQRRYVPVLIGLVFIAILLLFNSLLTRKAFATAQSAQYKEYEIKAAFIYNFLKFVDWPEQKMKQNGNQIIIGIIGQDPFGTAIDIFKDKTVEDRGLVVKRFDSLQAFSDEESTKEIKSCHLLFICSSEQRKVPEIISLVGKDNVLIVGDSADILDSGVIICFAMEDNKIRFDINLIAAEKNGLQIRSQLLRLARKVIKNDSANDTAQQEGK